MDNQENNSQSTTNINNLENIFSPIKEYNSLETPQIKSEGKFQILPSPLENSITPVNKIDYKILNQNNIIDTPNLISNSKPFSFISNSSNKINNMKLMNFVPKNLMYEFSPYKQNIPFNSPNKKNNNNYEKE
jgi:hypothetical protein